MDKTDTGKKINNDCLRLSPATIILLDRSVSPDRSPSEIVNCTKGTLCIEKVNTKNKWAV